MSKKKPKKRSSEYEKPLKLNGTFDGAIKELVSEPVKEYKKFKKKG